MEKRGVKTAIMGAVESIETHAPDVTVRVTKRMEIGQAIQQGDVYIARVVEAHPHGEQVGMDKHQVALGTGNGSRHVAEGTLDVFRGTTPPPGFSVMRNVNPQEVTGPVVKAKKRWTLTHPEHPHHSLPAGCYQVTYQFNPATMRRTVD